MAYGPVLVDIMMYTTSMAYNSWLQQLLHTCRFALPLTSACLTYTAESDEWVGNPRSRLG